MDEAEEDMTMMVIATGADQEAREESRAMTMKEVIPETHARTQNCLRADIIAARKSILVETADMVSVTAEVGRGIIPAGQRETSGLETEDLKKLIAGMTAAVIMTTGGDRTLIYVQYRCSLVH